MQNPFEELKVELKEIKILVNKLLTAPKEDYNLKMYTYKEAATIFNVDPQTITNHVTIGNLKAFKFGGLWRIKHYEIFDLDGNVKSVKYKRRQA